MFRYPHCLPLVRTRVSNHWLFRQRNDAIPFNIFMAFYFVSLVSVAVCEPGTIPKDVIWDLKAHEADPELISQLPKQYVSECK